LLDLIQQRAHRDASPDRAQLRPAGHAVDVVGRSLRAGRAL